MEWKLPDNAKDWLQLMTLIPALIVVWKIPALLAFVYRRYLKALEWLKMKMSTAVATAIMAQLSPRLDNIEGSVEEVRKQVFPNGGGSMNDAVSRVAALVKEQVKAMRIMRCTMLAHQDADLSQARFEADEHGHITWSSYALQAWTGRNPDQNEKLGWLTSVVEADRARVSAEWAAARAEGRDFLCGFEMKHAGGAKFCVEMFAKHIEHDGTTACLVGAITRRSVVPL